MNIVRAVFVGLAIAAILWLCSVTVRNFSMAINAPVLGTAATIDSTNTARRQGR